MGCDIHIVLEREHGRKWIAVDTFAGHESTFKGWASPVATSRNYARFAALAGVRGHGPQAKGLPPDISETAAMLVEDWGTDAHSASWLPLDEAAKIFLATDSPNGPGEYGRKYPKSHYFGVDEIDERNGKYRIVFWFDN